MTVMSHRLRFVLAGIVLALGWNACGTAVRPPARDSGGGRIAPIDLRCEYRRDPLGIDDPRPRLSWALASDGRAETQSAYRILVARSTRLLDADRGDLWDSGKVGSSESLAIAYGGQALRSGLRCYWKVRVWDGKGRPSAWSPAAFWETALLGDRPWQGRWISDGKPVPEREEDFYRDDPAPLFRKEFAAPERIARARLYITGLGYYEASINGRRVGDQVLDPGWTNYEKRVFYSVYDVTGLVRAGRNCLGVMLGNGWWNPLPLRMWGNRNLRADLPVGRPCLIAQLEIAAEDGSVTTVATGPDWKVRDGPLLRNNIYLGEVYDARREIPGWDSPGATEAGWSAAVPCPGPAGLLRAQPQPPIRITARVRPVRVAAPQPGVAIFDLGHNFAGWVRLRLRAPAGTQVRIRYGELLNADGSLNPLTSVCGQIKGRRRDGLPVGGPGAPEIAEQSDTYIARDGGEEVYTPRFTFHGFRYVEVTGLPGPPAIDDLEGLRLNADVGETGEFSCSNGLFNRIQEMVRQTFLSNIFSVQSDCPHRERFGYGGDLVATADAYLANFDMAAFYAKAAADWADAARPDGMLTDTAPFVGIQYCGLAWAMAHPYLQAKLVQHYGDRRLVEEQFDTTRRWLDLVTRANPGGIITDGLADHESLEPTSVPALVTPLYHEAAWLASRLAGLLGRREDEARYRELAASIGAAYRDKVLGPGPGRYEAMTQAGLAVALGLGLVPEADRAGAFEALVAKVSASGAPGLTTGIFGTKFLLDVLSRRGRADLAWALVDRKDFPGWGYMLDRGATTLWEHWAFSDDTYSHNHPMFGSVSEWFFAWVAGIQPDPGAVGFDRIVIRPQPVGDLTWAKGRVGTVRGEVRSEWRIEHGRFFLTVVVPVNATAAVYIPGTIPDAVREGGAPAATSEGVSFRGVEAGSCVYAVGSGRYEFSADLLPRSLNGRGLPAAGSR
jgi:alpha-L-rhamnosidase